MGNTKKKIFGWSERSCGWETQAYKIVIATKNEDKEKILLSLLHSGTKKNQRLLWTIKKKKIQNNFEKIEVFTISSSVSKLHYITSLKRIVWYVCMYNIKYLCIHKK